MAQFKHPAAQISQPTGTGSGTLTDAMLGNKDGVAAVGEDVALHYRRGSEPLQAGSKVPDLATLRGLLSDTQHRLVPALAAMSDDALTQSVPEQLRRPPLTGSVAEALLRLHYHEGYHNGQIGLLRRLAGKEGAIK